MRRAALLVGALVAGGCSHAWDMLDPSQSSAGGGGNESAGVSDTAVASGAGGSASSAVASVSAVSAVSSNASTSDASSSASGAGGGSTAGTIEYLASVTECAGFHTTDMSLVDPVTCADHAGNAEMNIDTSDGTLMAFLASFVRFDLDGALAGKTIDAVKLRLVVTTSGSAASTHSGEIWQVAPFTEADLAMALPDKVGMAPISPDMGAVAINQAVTWQLPANIIAPDAPVFLEIFPVSGDGTYYWKKDGPLPPKLIIDYH
jgi:hypothetical protein